MNIFLKKVTVNLGKTKRLKIRSKERVWRNFIAQYIKIKFFYNLVWHFSLRSISPFAFHTSFIKNTFGSILKIECNVESLEHTMYDWIDADKIIFHCSDYFIMSGDWSELKMEFSKSPVMREVAELIEAKWNYRQTKTYASMVEKMNQGNPLTKQQIKMDAIKNIEDYFERFHKLYESIKSYGVLGVEALNNIGLKSEKDIGVAIDKDGKCIRLPGGQHRLAIAVALKIQKIPVEVRMIHRDLILNHREYIFENPKNIVERILSKKLF